MTTPSKDRLAALTASSVVNGIDFVEVKTADQKTLIVHFVNKIRVEGSLPTGKNAVSITGGERIATVPVNPINDATDWGADTDGKPLLTLTVNEPGDFSFYTLTLNSTVLDDFFKQAVFSFKTHCPSTLDCADKMEPCPEDAGDLPPIDYLAKDFLSFRKALLDFSSLRYPEWQERSEADFGIMFMEALSSLGDDLSYLQDRLAAESTLDTATQRQSIVRHARLVDYEPRPTASAKALVQVDVAAGVSSLTAGVFAVYAKTPDGGRIAFEIGEGLIEPSTGLPPKKAVEYTVNPLWNRNRGAGLPEGIQPYWWDDSQRCLKAGATRMWVGEHGWNFIDGQLLLIESDGATPADPKIREIIKVKRVEGTVYETTDELFSNMRVTLLEWYADTALAYDHDLTQSRVVGNLVPATQGSRRTETFMIPSATPPSEPSQALALWRTGPSSSPTLGSPSVVTDQYIYTLQQQDLSWLAQDDAELPPLPEIVLTEVAKSGVSTDWTWRRQLLQAPRFETAYALDPVNYVRINGSNEAYAMHEYDGSDGYSIRFGGGDFGLVPQAEASFQVLYRIADGAVGNVAADSITEIDPSSISTLLAVSNPFPAAGGSDAETDEQVRRRAPYAFRAKQYRAVRPEDYRKAAETLPWVSRAGATFRWTGSWLTGFVTADPKGTERITLEQNRQLIRLLNRYRLAGYEVYAPPPRYVGLDLQIQVCALPDAYRGQVEGDILAALTATKRPNGKGGFFYLDSFTFGTPLELSALEAAIQGSPGVRGVLSVRYRRRGLIPNYIDMPDIVEVGSDEIIRVDNDPNFPEKGSIQVSVGGGK